MNRPCPFRRWIRRHLTRLQWVCLGAGAWLLLIGACSSGRSTTAHVPRIEVNQAGLANRIDFMSGRGLRETAEDTPPSGHTPPGHTPPGHTPPGHTPPRPKDAPSSLK